MLNLLLPNWNDLASIAQPTFLMMALFVMTCGWILLRREA